MVASERARAASAAGVYRMAAARACRGIARCI